MDDGPEHQPSRGTSDTAVVEVVGRALELSDAGVTPDLLELAAGDAALASAAEAALETVRRLPELQARAAGRESWAGRTLASRYRLIRRLGSGAMGVVYEAFDQELRRAVAIKVLRSGLLEKTASAAARFAREAEMLAAIRHPAVVTLFDRGETPEGEVFLVMERLEGMSLAEVLDEIQEAGSDIDTKDTAWVARRLGLEELREPNYMRAVVRWVAELCTGLEAVHDAGCYHRDVKPSNVFLCSDGRPVLIDFGIATRLDRAETTREGSALGTPAYIAPEVLDTRSKPAPPQDVYGLTATLYHMLTRRAPYQGTPSQVLTAVATSEPLHPLRARPGLPRDLVAILERGMAREPGQRYPTVGALEADLRAFLDYRPVQARPSTALGRTARRALRSKTVRGAFGMAVLVVFLMLGGLARSEASARRQARARQAWSRVLYLQTISELPANRVHALPESDERQLALLDEAVRHATSPIPARLVRAAFRADHGDREGAKRDMRAVASAAGPFARALAERFSALPDEGATWVDSAGLPDPHGHVDLFVAAYQGMREVRFRDACDLLAGEWVQEYLPAWELHLVLRPFMDRIEDVRVPLEERARRCRAIEEDISAFEGAVGAPTASSLHSRAYVALVQLDYPRALDLCDAALRMAPDSTGPRTNGALAALHAGFHDLVVHYAEPATIRLPGAYRSFDTWIRSLLAERRLDEAEQLLERAPYDHDNQRQRILWLRRRADLLALRAWTAVSSEEVQAAAWARDALEAYGQLAELDGGSRHGEQLARGVLTKDPNRIFDGLLQGLKATPTNEESLRVAIEHLPESLDSSNRDHLLEFLRSLRDFVSVPARVPSKEHRE